VAAGDQTLARGSFRHGYCVPSDRVDLAVRPPWATRRAVGTGIDPAPAAALRQRPKGAP
jgi:hypothetical protein